MNGRNNAGRSRNEWWGERRNHEHHSSYSTIIVVPNASILDPRTQKKHKQDGNHARRRRERYLPDPSVPPLPLFMFLKKMNVQIS
mmetsp:Transcript_17520/g.48373  ORF Transcript_17520/g.48373 Transcript_17520/m.48373 type:complete len:85 (-) Transcript_17520:209-463(-)